MTFLAIVCLIVGISVGIKLALMIQGLLILCSLLYLHSDGVRRMEMGALIPMAFVFAFISGVVIGDAVFFMFYQQTTDPVNIVEILTWPFKP